MRCVICALLILLSVVNVGKATLSGTLQQLIRPPSEDKPVFDSAFDAFVQATLREWHVPGLSIAVVDNGKIFSKVSLTPYHLHVALRFRSMLFAEETLSLTGLRICESTRYKSNRRYAILYRQHNESIHRRRCCTIGPR
jgi:hypothetical protein